MRAGFSIPNVVIERLRSCKDVPSVANCLLERSLELVNTTLGNIQLMDSKTGTLEIAAQRGFHPDFLNFFRQVKAQDGCACGRVVRYREPTIIQDVMLDEEFAPYRKIALRAGFRAVQSTPIISSSGAFVGVVSTHFPTSHRPSNDQMALIKTIAQHAADQIVRHRSPRTRSNANRFLAALPQADYALLAPHLRTISLDRGTILHDAGEPIAHVYFPHSGMISIIATMRDGATVEIASLGRASIICANAALGSHFAVGRAVVQLPGTASQIAAERLQAAVQKSPAIRELAVRYNDLLLVQVQQSVACNALHRLEQRLCGWLLQSHDCCDGDAVPLTQESLAEMLGVRRTSVTVTASLLQAQGMINYRRGHIHIADRAALERAACECYSTIRGHTDKVFEGWFWKGESAVPRAI